VDQSINQSQITAHNRDLYFNKTKVKPTKLLIFNQVQVFNASVKLFAFLGNTEMTRRRLVGIEQSF